MKTAALKLAKWISETSDFNMTDLLDLAGEVRTATAKAASLVSCRERACKRNKRITKYGGKTLQHGKSKTQYLNQKKGFIG